MGRMYGHTAETLSRRARMRNRHDPGDGPKEWTDERLIIEISITTAMGSSNPHVAGRPTTTRLGSRLPCPVSCYKCPFWPFP